MGDANHNWNEMWTTVAYNMPEYITVNPVITTTSEDYTTTTYTHTHADFFRWAADTEFGKYEGSDPQDIAEEADNYEQWEDEQK